MTRDAAAGADKTTGANDDCFGRRGRKIAGASDEFWTPAYALSPLLPFLPKDKVVWECAWGAGELAKHLRAAGYHVVGHARMDFLTQQRTAWTCRTTPG